MIQYNTLSYLIFDCLHQNFLSIGKQRSEEIRSHPEVAFPWAGLPQILIQRSSTNPKKSTLLASQTLTFLSALAHTSASGHHTPDSLSAHFSKPWSQRSQHSKIWRRLLTSKKTWPIPEKTGLTGSTSNFMPNKSPHLKTCLFSLLGNKIPAKS